MTHKYTVYALYYEHHEQATAISKGFIGSTRRSPSETLNDHQKWINNGTHTNHKLNAVKGRQLALYVISAGLSLEQCNELLNKLRPHHDMGWNITKAGRGTSDRHTGKKRSTKTRKLISTAMMGQRLGQKYSDEHRANISKGSQNRYRPVNVYDYVSGAVIAENVCLSRWAKAQGISPSNLYATTNANFAHPHNWKRNRYHTKGIYARYVAESGPETATERL